MLTMVGVAAQAKFVSAYTTEAVDVNGGGVVVRVRGQGLQLLVMTEQELRITGKISGIDLVE